MAETTPNQPPDADTWSGADIFIAIGGNVPTLVGAISPRLAGAIGGSADIAIATPNASAKAPARSMFLVAPNAFISYQFPEGHGVCSVTAG
jgi:hypothetical protein